MAAYPFLLWVHVISAAILFGTGLGTAYYFHAAHRSRDPRLIAAIGRLVIKADWLFTGISGLVQPATGYALIRTLGLTGLEGWLILAYGLYALALFCWLPVVWLQYRATALAAAAAQSGEPLPAAYDRLMRWWHGLGWPAFLALIAIFGLMLVKPDF